MLKEFNEFSDTCKPTIIRLWYYNNYNKNYEPLEKYIYTYKRTRKYMNFTNSYEKATRFTSKLRLDVIKRACERNGYKAEFIQVK